MAFPSITKQSFQHSAIQQLLLQDAAVTMGPSARSSSIHILDLETANSESYATPASPSTETDDEPDTETFDNASLDGGQTELEDALAVASSETSRGPRKRNFRKFQDPAYEIVLLRAIDATKPFGAQHGKTKEAWQGVIKYLQDYDMERFQKQGEEPMFEGVTLRLCQSKWEALSNEQRKFQVEMDKATGVSPEMTERRILMQDIYHYEQACANAAKEAKEQRTRKRQRANDDRHAGRLLLEASITGPVRRQDDVDSESSSSATTPGARTPPRKKRVHIDALYSQLEAAKEQAQAGKLLQERQLELLTKGQEEQRQQLESHNQVMRQYVEEQKNTQDRILDILRILSERH
ncbi:hypothetical protein BC939DRAFT_453928 [Gamsiella multidivaricata]|uniref:uncharacterized protein n=1 Tax=Gamsiella multidivaricata TaxID=101098 RepID=UPI002220671A|nr:uncharacterized protein BC939DRAFT_453928 [Gamsiella multidivaricata]KAG0351304.1 hypothetical protein BGZ54_003325 [Gamsiella multidivaricata]KAI7822368.1 hypothetical protein BC939DRAFT_453928 [Gamsiella multidivaricata]